MEGKYFIIYCNTSYSALAAVLMHYRNVISYASWKFKVDERSYLIRDLELVPVAFALK